ncbi:hypothetical protein PTKIN_Ptkin15bG0190600 [Pterospermum kingtungense]
MGNSIGGSKKAKVMKIDGETFKLKTPVRAWDVVKDYPGHVLLDSEAVKHFGVRAKPLEPQQDLKPKRIYFLVELPKFPVPDESEKAPRRVRSEGIHMSAKDRLECLMLSRRSVSDLSMVRPISTGPGSGGMTTVKMRLPKSQMAKLVEESRDGVEVAEKILNLYMENTDDQILHPEAPWKPGLGSIGENFKAKREKRVSFVSQEEGEIRLANQ